MKPGQAILPIPRNTDEEGEEGIKLK